MCHPAPAPWRRAAAGASRFDGDVAPSAGASSDARTRVQETSGGSAGIAARARFHNDIANVLGASRAAGAQRDGVDAVVAALPGLRNPKWYCFMNASVQALFALPGARSALRTARQGRPADRGGRRFAERGSAEQRSRRAPDFDALLVETSREMESSSGPRPAKLYALPRVFYDGRSKTQANYCRISWTSSELLS